MKALLLLFLSFLTAQVVAVEAAPVLARFKLVGVISTSSEKDPGIVVIKDRVADKTFTLRKGENLPFDVPLRVGAIERSRVTLHEGGQSLVLAYEGRAADEEEKTEEKEKVEEKEMPAFSEDAAKDEEVLRKLLFRTRGLPLIMPMDEGEVEEYGGEEYGH